MWTCPVLLYRTSQYILQSDYVSSLSIYSMWLTIMYGLPACYCHFLASFLACDICDYLFQPLSLGDFENVINK